MPIFRATRVRGRAGDDLSPAVLRRMGRSLAEALTDRPAVVVGGDCRVSTPDLKAALIEGLIAGGRAVADVGAASAPVVNYACRMLRSDAAVLVTAGAGLPDENGLMFWLPDFPNVAEAIEQVRSAFEGPDMPDLPGGAVESWGEDILDEYLAWLARAVLPAKDDRTMGVVVDAGNGCLADVAPLIAHRRRGLTIEVIHDEVRGDFPGRGPNPSAAGALAPLAARVREAGAALGVAFDAAGSCARFVDDNGREVSTDDIAIVLLRRMEAGMRGRPVVLDCRATRALVEEVRRLGGKPLLERPESELICGRMRRDAAVFGVGTEGVFAFIELGGEADAVYAAVRVIETLRSAEQPLSELRKDIPATRVVRDVTVPCGAASARTILNRVRARFPGAAQTEVGGIRVKVERGWAAVLPSEAEGLVAFSFEAENDEALDGIASEVLSLAPEVRGEARRLVGLPDAPAADPYAYLDDEKF